MLTSSGLDDNPLLAFHSEESAQTFSDDSAVESSRFNAGDLLSRLTRPERGNAIHRWLDGESRLLTAFDAFVGLAAAVGLGLALQAATSRSLRPSVPTDVTIDLVNAIEFDRCAIDVQGARAVASCQGSARYGPGIGNRNAPTDARQWRFNLRKVNDAWLIQEVDSGH